MQTNNGKKRFFYSLSFLIAGVIILGGLLISVHKRRVKERVIVKEIIEERTENKKIFLNSDGSYSMKLFKRPVHYKRGNTYEEIDNAFVLIDDSTIVGDKIYKNKANNIAINVNENITDDNPVVMKYDKYKLSFKPIYTDEYVNFKFLRLDNNGKMIEEHKKGRENIESISSLEYRNESTGLRYSALVDGIKEEIILYENPKNNIFEFYIDTENISLKLDENGQILILDKDKEEIIGGIPKPFMYDSSEDNNYSENIEVKLVESEEDKGKYRVSLIADNEFLTNESTKYPVIIDPTAAFGTVSTWADSYVQSAYPNTNYRLSTELRAGYVSSIGKARSYIRYKSLPSLGNVAILSATYYAYNISNIAYGNFAFINLHRVTNDWDPSTITWNNAASYNASEEGASAVSSNGWASWDFTQIVRDWYSGAQSNYGFVLKDSEETSKYRKFYSSDGTNVPYMQIDYAYLPVSPTNVPCQALSTGVNTGKGYVNLSWNAVDYATGYKVAIFNGSYYEYYDVGNVTSWSSLGKKIWPTATEVNNGRYQLHKDGLGDDLPNDPKSTYANSSGGYGNSSNYWFRIAAYNQYGESNIFDNWATPTLPDSTSPNAVNNIVFNTINNPPINTPNSWNSTISWGQASDRPMSIGSGIKSYKVRLYQEGVSGKKSEVEVSAAPYSVNFNSLLDNTKYYTTVQAFDMNGNYTAETKSSTITTGDRTAPAKPSSVTLDKTSWSNSPTVIISWTGITDNVALKDVQYAIDTNAWINTGKNTSSGSYTINTGQLAEGEHLIYLRGIDNANNQGGVTSVKYYKDTVIPQGTINNVTDMQSVTGTIDISATIYDLNIKNWTLDYAVGEEGSNYTLLTSGSTNITNQQIYSWNTEDLASDIYILRLKVTDLAGNEKIYSLRVNVANESSTGNTTIKTSKKEFDVVISGSKIESVKGRSIEVYYDPQDLDVLDLSSITNKKELSAGKIEGTNIVINQIEPGYIKFSVEFDISDGSIWSGVLNSIKFNSKKNGEVEVSYIIK